ncbi:uncharacterized protein [Anabrus simplex]|uniref:uncharacterized protein n=1 Tax=Anabrus simplex TaxID=316456 RepID=UPI0035A3367B
MAQRDALEKLSTEGGESMALYQLLMMLFCSSVPCMLAYPVFGTKRYGRSGHHLSSWGVPAPMPMTPYQPPHAQTHHYGYGIASPSPYYPSEPIMTYPYTHDYSDTDYYYHPEPAFSAYPYYPSTTKYPALYHHSVMPYYYTAPHHQAHHPGYGYYAYDDVSDPVDDIQEEIQQEEEREEREEALPIGQETWFENSSPSQEPPQQEDNMDDVNAVFLHNLILSQMYNDAMNRGAGFYHHTPVNYGYHYPYAEEDESANDGWIYGDVRSNSDGEYDSNNEEDSEDEDVKELKSLVKKPYRRTSIGKVKTMVSKKGRPLNSDSEDQQAWVPTEGGTWLHYNPSSKRSGDYDEYPGGLFFNKKQPEYGEWVPQRGNTINFTDRKTSGFFRSTENSESAKGKPVTTPSGPVATTTMPPAVTSKPSEESTTTTTPAPDFDARRGMKEVALLRPASHIRRPPYTPMTRSLRPRHGPSVYDTIKQLLNMEQGLRKVTEHPRPQKRYVSSEESLVQELSVLKKMSA